MLGPLVSIIIPCYRQAHFMAGAIESALNQTYRPIEVIVINDGSDDSTEAVAKNYQKQIRYRWQANKGLPGARNTGISLAAGKYLLFLDCDDELHPDAVRHLVEAADDRDDVLCVMGFRIFERDVRSAEPEQLPPDAAGIELGMMLENLGPPHTHLCPRSLLIENGRFDPALKSHEDWDAWLRLIFGGARMVPVPFAGAFYRTHPQSMSRNEHRMAVTRAEVLHRTLRRIQETPNRVVDLGGDPLEISAKIREKLERDLFDTAYTLRQRGEYLEALSQYRRSIKDCGLHLRTLAGMVKLIPHWLARPALFRNLTPA